jgi:hypothetical protein
MIQVFIAHHPSQKTGGCHAAVDHCRWHRFRRDDFARLARILRTDVAVNKEFCGFYIQLLGDVLADLDQFVTTLPTLARFRFMTVLNAWQVIRQRLAARASTR